MFIFNFKLKEEQKEMQSASPGAPSTSVLALQRRIQELHRGVSSRAVQQRLHVWASGDGGEAAEGYSPTGHTGAEREHAGDGVRAAVGQHAACSRAAEAGRKANASADAEAGQSGAVRAAAWAAEQPV